MRCQYCNADKGSLHVIDSRSCEEGRSIRRRRKCLSCGKRFTTYERIEQPNKLMVIKKDGRRIPWDKSKILSGLERACFKRPVPETELLRIADEVEEEVFGTFDREVPTGTIGQWVTDRLRRVDQVAYVRFASVYKQFRTVQELMDEARLVIDAKRFEDPTQGRLFLDPPASGGNGNGPAEDQPPHPHRGRPRGRKQKADVAGEAGPQPHSSGDEPTNVD